VYQEQLAIGTQQLDLHDNPDAQKTFSGTLSEPLACRISAQVDEGNWLELAAESRAWSLLRWAATATHAPAANGRLLLSWTLSGKDAKSSKAATPAAPAKTVAKAPAKGVMVEPPQSSWLFEVLIEEGPAVGLFSRRVFDDLSFPSTIVIRSLE
jgi:type VI protein secretion system component VasK